MTRCLCHVRNRNRARARARTRKISCNSIVTSTSTTETRIVGEAHVGRKGKEKNTITANLSWGHPSNQLIYHQVGVIMRMFVMAAIILVLFFVLLAFACAMRANG